MMVEFVRLNAQIPKQLDIFTTRRIEEGAFSNRSEYIRHLIRQDMEQQKLKEIQRLNSTLSKSTQSGVSTTTSQSREQRVNKIIESASKHKKEAV